MSAAEVEGDEAGIWWLSFCDADLPEGSQFLGVAIVTGTTMADAITTSHFLGCNPGGEVMAIGPMSSGAIAPEWMFRLLSKDEAHSVVPVKGVQL